MVHKYSIRVRYSDTDQMRRLHHGAFVDYLEVARIEWLRNLGFSYAAIEERGYGLPVIRLNVDYKGFAAYDEEILFETSVSSLSPVRVQFHSELTVKDRLVARADVELVCIDCQSLRPVRMPSDLHDALSAAM